MSEAAGFGSIFSRTLHSVCSRFLFCFYFLVFWQKKNHSNKLGERHKASGFHCFWWFIAIRFYLDEFSAAAVSAIKTARSEIAIKFEFAWIRMTNCCGQFEKSREIRKNNFGLFVPVSTVLLGIEHQKHILF